MYTKKGTRALVKKLKGELSYLEGEYKKLIKDSDKRELCYSELLLCDNFYLIEQTAKNAVQGIEQVKLRADIGYEYPRIFCHISDYIDLCLEDEISGDSLADYLEKKQKKEPYESGELYLLESVFSGAIVSKLYLVLKEDRKNEAKATSLIKLLFARKNIDFDEVFENVSVLERILLRDPSGIYEKCDRETKAAYRRAVLCEAKRRGTGEIEYASRILEIAGEASGEAHSLGYYLVREKKHPLRSSYFPLVSLVTAALLSLYFLLVGHDRGAYYFAALFLILPLFDLAKQVASMVMSRLCTPKILPALKLDKIDDGMRTLTVVTTLLFGEKNDGAIFDRLEDFYNLSPEENVYFGVLCDLPDSKEPRSIDDDAILDYAARRIEALNAKYGNRFFLFSRERTYSLGERRYMGWERKRGALIELVRLIKGVGTGVYTLAGDVGALAGVKYIITLDSDTRLSHTSIKRLVGTAAHPQNRPKIEKTDKGAVVKEGYGIMQPRMISSLESVSRSYFSLMQCGSGGVEFYDTCDFNIYAQLFGEGIFCGKGIFDVDAFYSVIDGAFPEDSILSHDMLEGARLRAAYLGDVTLVDSAPSSSMSYYDRLHRWIRGDVQALAFARAPVNALGKFKLIDNILRALTPVSALFAILTAAFVGGAAATEIALFALLYLIFPAFISFVLPIVSRNVGAYKVIVRSYFSYAVGGMVKDAANMLYCMASLAYLSYVSVDALMRAVWRMLFSHRHMLEWTTADESERKKNTLGAYVWRMQISIWVGFGVLILTDELVCDMLALMFIAFPFAAYLLSKNIVRPDRKAASQKRTITKYARAMWHFFEDTVTSKDSFLPPDNYQVLPREALAHRTSPTNIGMYLLCVLSARDFGFIDTDEMAKRLENTLASIEKMEKWEGHLYNWYDTRTLDILMPGYISTVDSGNFVCSLLALREGIVEYAHENTALLDIAKRIDALVGEVDFAPLYNKARKLFYIGFDPVSGKKDDNYYDLYMSEARLASYFAIAKKQVPDEHWRALGRYFIGDGNHIGIASWSGTAFEYFMPALFLPVYPNSMAYEGLMFASSMYKKGAVQTRTENGHIRAVWGKSESGFYSFDSEMNYRYRAIGEEKLGLVRAPNEDRVFSAYSLFLMLKASVRDALLGLDAMKDVGAYGKYGFYEAIDLTPSRVGRGRAVVKSYMAHHVGMSMIASANAVYDDVFCRRFMKNPTMRASSLLLAEKLPADAIIYKKQVREVDEGALKIIELIRNRAEIRVKRDAASSGEIGAAILSDGRMRALATSLGYISLLYGDRAVTSPDPDSLLPFSILFEADGKVYALNNESGLCFNSSKGKITYTKEVKGKGALKAKADITLDSENRMMLVGFEAEGDFETMSPGLVFEPILCSENDYKAHSSFAKLFVEAEFSAKEKILLFRRKRRGENEQEIWLGVAYAESGGEVEYEIKTERFLSELAERADVKAAFARLDGSQNESGLQACVDPVCVMKRHSAANGKYRCEFIVAIGDDKDSLLASVIDARRKKNRMHIAEKRCALYSATRERLASCDERAGRAASYILASLIHRTEKNAGIENLRALMQGQDALWKHGISGDEKIVFVDASGRFDRRAVRLLLASHKLLWLSGVRFELVILYRGNGEYSNPEKAELEREIISFGADEFVGRRAGIFLLSDGSINRAEYELFSLISRVYLKLDPHMGEESLIGALKAFEIKKNVKKTVRRTVRKSLPDSFDKELLYKVYGGGFYKDGFWVDKRCSHGAWSYVYCNSAFGTLVTHNSLGFTWYKNSREMRLSEWSPDQISYKCTEHVYLEREGVRYDLAALSSELLFEKGCAKYRGEAAGVKYTLSVGCDVRLPAKPIHVKTEMQGVKGAKLIYSFCGVLGNMKKYDGTLSGKMSPDGIFVESLFGNREWGAFLFGSEEAVYSAHGDEFCISYGDVDDGEYYFVLGARPSFSDKSEKYIKKRFADVKAVLDAYKAYADNVENLFSPIKLECDDISYKLMAEYYLPYQLYFIRMLARSGFYQSSGAYGFRDQLQDSLGALYFNSAITKRQIIRCAAHEYEEGDVQHWWHSSIGGGRFGIRSRYSDDSLWLVFAVCEYIEHTGDASLLDTEVRYLHSAPLAKNESERCEVAALGDEKGTVYSHCIRAVEHSLAFGAHGLSLFFGGDWNDGMNAVGREGRGESVWLSWFLLLVLEKFIPYCQEAAAEKYEKIRKTLLHSVEKNAWDGKWYLRGFYDDGTPLGSCDSDECRIDVMSQSFAAFLKEPPENAVSALYSAYDNLFDKKKGIMKLFSPPFDTSAKEPGYIKSYPAGIRENGGQYTHAAVWYAMALYAAGESEKGKEVLDALNPILKCADTNRGKIYRNEPYFMSGDIYTAKGEYGRGGWSGYTGAAAWYLRAILENVDVKEKINNQLLKDERK